MHGREETGEVVDQHLPYTLEFPHAQHSGCRQTKWTVPARVPHLRHMDPCVSCVELQNLQLRVSNLHLLLVVVPRALGMIQGLIVQGTVYTPKEFTVQSQIL